MASSVQVLVKPSCELSSGGCVQVHGIPGRSFSLVSLYQFWCRNILWLTFSFYLAT